MKFSRRSVTAYFVFLSILSLALPQLTVASSPFSLNLQLRDTGGDVTHLQQFLNAEHFFIAQSGPGSPGNETTTFGLLTYQALTLFQSAHGLPAAGFFGPLTRALIATLAASSTATSTPPSSVGISTVVASSAPSTTSAFSAPATTTSGRYFGPYIPGVTPLPGYAPGQIIFIGGGAPVPTAPPASPPAPAPYVAKAVHFDGNNVLVAKNITTNDNGLVSFSLWLKTSDFSTFPGIFVSNPDTPPSLDPYENFLASYDGTSQRFQLGSAASDIADGGSITLGQQPITIPFNSWSHLLVSAQTNLALLWQIFNGGEFLGFPREGLRDS